MWANFFRPESRFKQAAIPRNGAIQRLGCRRALTGGGIRSTSTGNIVDGLELLEGHFEVYRFCIYKITAYAVQTILSTNINSYSLCDCECFFKIIQGQNEDKK